MGLGPPICVDCKLIMQFNGAYPYWTCTKCGKNGHQSTGVSHLFCVSPDEAKEYEENTKVLKATPYEHTFTIGDKAPVRLRGKELKATVNRTTQKLTFSVADVPEDMTAQEKGYLEWSIGEMVDKLREKFPALIGEMGKPEIRKDD